MERAGEAEIGEFDALVLEAGAAKRFVDSSYQRERRPRRPE